MSALRKLGLWARWSSGLPFSFIQSFSDLDDVRYVQSWRVFGSNNGGTFEPEHRNIHRNTAVYDFNTRIEKSFVPGKVSATGFFEVSTSSIRTSKGLVHRSRITVPGRFPRAFPRDSQPAGLG